MAQIPVMTWTKPEEKNKEPVKAALEGVCLAPAMIKPRPNKVVATQARPAATEVGKGLWSPVLLYQLVLNRPVLGGWTCPS